MQWMTESETPGAPWQRALYEARAAGLLLYGRSLGLGHGEAEDVLHDTFAALLALPAPPDAPERYCLRAYRNRALNLRRSLWRRLAAELECRRWFESAPDETPLERAAMKCLAQLPVEQREVIVLKIWHGHTFEAVAGLTGCLPNTAASRYRYGLEKLRACLKGTEHEPEPGNPAAILEAATPLAEG